MAEQEEGKGGRPTTNASETRNLMWVAGVPSVLTARTSRRNGGFWPDSSASELPAGGMILISHEPEVERLQGTLA